MADGGALLHSCAVYLYAYDTEQGAYAQQTDAAVGCALLAGENAAASGSDAFSLLLYDAQKAPLLQVPVTPSARFTPQKDHYVNFYDRAQQRNYAMRFKDAASSEAFLSAVAFSKAQVLLHASKSFDHATRGNKPVVLVDQLAIGKEDAVPIAYGDVAGVALTKWQGTVASRDDFFSANPLEIAHQPPTEATNGSEVRRIRLVEGGGGDQDPFVRALAGEALVGMQKASKRLVTVALPHSQEWMIAQVELLKVKKARPSATVATTSAAPTPVAQEAAAAAPATVAEDESHSQGPQGDHDELVKRMASLSRMGSQSSGLIASVKSRMSNSLSMDSNGSEKDMAGVRRSSSLEHPALDTSSGRVPVLLAGLQLPGQRIESFSRSPTSEMADTYASSHESSGVSSLAAKVIEPLKQTPSTSASASDMNNTPTGTLSTDMERLMKEQTELARLREQLEESKRKLQSDDLSTSAAPPAPSLSSSTNDRNSIGGASPASMEHRASSSSSAPYTPSSFAMLGSTTSSLPTSSTYGTTNRWTPSSLELVPSFSSPPVPSSLSHSATPSLPTPSFSSSLTPYSTPSFPGSSGFTPGSTVIGGSGTSRDVENGIVRLQRSSTTIESTLQDLQSKMDRLLNSQHSMKSSKFTSSTGKYGSSSSFSASTSSSSSSSSLLKNLEKALSQRDQLQETNARLQEANEELESNIEELQTQHESLQRENRTLLDKLQNGNHLQQEKFRLELRSVQQQLSQTQEQMLVYQEENFQLRAELAAKDEQLAKEKTHLQEDARKQLEQLQRQLQEQVRQESKDAMDKLMGEKQGLEAQVADLAAQKKQWEAERDAMTNKLRQAQGQQTQLQDEVAKAQATQDARVQELMARVQELEAESGAFKQQAEGQRSETQHLEELLMAKDKEMAQLLAAKNDQEYAALSELFKEFMNDIYFHFQDAFDEETEFMGKEIVMAIRKILKQNTMDILAKLEEFYQLQAQSRQQ